MSIATEITRLQNAKASIKTSLENKGATIPSSTKLDGYSTIIDALPNATKYGISIDNIIGGVDNNGDLQQISGTFDLVLSGIQRIQQNNVLQYKFSYNPAIKSVSFPDLVNVGAFYGGEDICNSTFFGCSNLETASFPELIGTDGNYSVLRGFSSAFSNCVKLKTLSMPKLKNLYQSSSALESICYNCTALTSFNLDSLEEVHSSMLKRAFQNCSSLTSASFPKVVEIFNEGMSTAFSSCSSLTSASFPVLERANSYRAFYSCFSSCPSLTSISFPALEEINNSQVLSYCFSSCSSLTSVSFPALTSQSFGTYTNQFQNMLSNTSGCTVHFPSNLQSVIGSWSDITNGMGGTNTTISFDLPATN